MQTERRHTNPRQPPAGELAQRIKLYYSDTFELPLPAGHKFPMAKYRLLRDRIADSALMASCDLEIAPAADDQQLELVHSGDYIRRVVRGELSAVDQRRIGFPWSPAMVERARRSVGATIAAAASALERGFAASLAGGTHHAFADSGQGYCVFNDCCVAARWVQRQGLARRVAIVDLDVHQGNGSAAIAADDPNLFTFSIHCAANFPFRKSASKFDLELPAGTTDGPYLAALEQALAPAFERFAPDLVLYVSGADPFADDRFGKLKLSKPGLVARDRTVYEYFRTMGIPVAATMAGGYARRIEDLVEIHFGTIASGADVFASGRGRRLLAAR